MKRLIVIFVLVGFVISAVTPAYAESWGKAILEGLLTYTLNKPSTRQITLQGDNLASKINAKYHYSHPDVETVLDNMMRDIAASYNKDADKQVKRPKVYLIDIKENGKSIPNAMALPGSGGGHIFVTWGLVKLFTENEDDVGSDQCMGGVLAHEFAHIVHGHSKRQVNNSATGQAVSIALTIGLGANRETESGIQIIEFLRENGYSRKHELQADKTATIILSKTRFGAFSLARSLKLISKKEGGMSGGMMSTHPSVNERLAVIEKTAKSL